MNTTTMTLAGLGIRSGELQTLRRYSTELAGLLAIERSSLPSHEHPVVDRLLVSYASLDPVGGLEHRMACDPPVIAALRIRLTRTSARLHSNAPLTTADISDLGTTLVLIRVLLAWKVGVLGEHGLDDKMRNASRSAGSHAVLAHAWLWCGLVIARLTGQSDESDADFGL